MPILFLGLLGTGAELLLLQHTRSLWELVPLVLIGLSLVTLTWHAITLHPRSVRAVQGVIGLFLIAGVANSALAKGIAERRPFANMMDLHKFLIQSLDSKQLSELYTKMFLPVNLNTATREEIMLIPGMGNRMVREFLEYRPYTAITQFRKEIGKYVDDTEVARLEQYVFVPINPNSASDETLLSIPGLTPQLIRALKDHRPYKTLQEFRTEVARYVNAKELGRLERYITIN